MADRGTLSRYGGYRGNKIPGADQNWQGEGTPIKTINMSTCDNNILPLVGPFNKGNPMGGSDRDIGGPVASQGRMDSGGDQLHGNENAQDKSKAEADALRKRWAMFREAHLREEVLLRRVLELLDDISKEVEEHHTAKKTTKGLVKKVTVLRGSLDEARIRAAELRERFGPALEGAVEKVAVTPILVSSPSSAPPQRTGNKVKRSRSSPTSSEDEVPTKRVKRKILRPVRLNVGGEKAGTLDPTVTTPLATTGHGKNGLAGNRDAEWEVAGRHKGRRKGSGANGSTTQRATQQADVGRRGDASPGKGKKRNKKRKRGTARKRARPEAVLIKPKVQGLTYADMLKRIKQGEDAKDVAPKVSKIRKTKDGHLLIELQKGVKADSVESALKGAIQDSGEIRRLSPTVTLEVLDIDGVSTLQEVKDALVAELGAEHAESIKTRTIRPGYRGTQIAVITVPAELARGLLNGRKIRVGFVIVRIREKGGIPRCFNCLQYGHLSAKCDKPQEKRPKRCFNCGDTEHLASDCTSKKMKCLSCEALQVDHNHRSGMLCCKAYQQAKATYGCQNKRGNG